MTHLSEQITNHVECQEKSGLTIVEYCRQNNLSKSTFYGWRHRRKQKAASNKDKPPSTIPFVEIPLTLHQSLSYSVDFSDEIKVSIPTGFNKTELQELLFIIKETL